MREKTLTIDGDFNFENTTVGIMAELVYSTNRDGTIDYLDIRKMEIYNEETGGNVDATPAQMTKFQEANWNYLEKKCLKNEDYLAEMYHQQMMDNRDDYGDWVYHNRVDELMEGRRV